MASWIFGPDIAFLTVVGAAGLGLLAWPSAVRALDRRFGGAVRWWTIALGVAAIYGIVIGYNLAVGLYDCSYTGGVSDALAFLASGRAFLSGRDPFEVVSCGTAVQVPYGISTVLVNALGSTGGLPGITIVWGAVTVAVVPLTWWVAGPDRRRATLTLATSLLFVPLAVGQIDGASNMIVPAAILASLAIARYNGPLGAAIGGFFATGRFPALFPTAGAAGRFPRRALSVLAAIGAFAAVSAATLAVYGRSFVTIVFAGELSRHSFSLNAWGVLLAQGWLPSSEVITAAQAALIVALLLVLWWRASSPLGAVVIGFAGVALLTQYLSFNFLAWLLPVALVPGRPRWWLWAIGVVGTFDYAFAFSIGVADLGVVWPYELLDLAMTALLIGLFLDLWRWDQGARRPTPVATTS